MSAEPQRIKLVIAYDGADYEGWQVQKTGRGVQQVIEEALERLFQAPFRIHGSSRTDTGVHARAMVAHFDLPAGKLKIPMEKLALAINSQLPPDVRIMDARRVPPDFHARFDAKGKQYRYTVYNDRAMDPLMRRIAWHVPKKLDLAAMREAAAHFKGKRDWAAFANNRSYEMESTVRTLHRCEMRKRGPLLTFIIEGDGFLYKMCRGIVGTIVQVGEGRVSAADIPRILDTRDRSMAGMTAPAHGLVLWKVFY